MRVVIADDQTEVRSALRLIAEQEVGLSVVGEAGDVDELLSLAEIVDPGLVLLDWELPDAPVKGQATQPNGRVLNDLRLLCPHAFVIALSGRPETRGGALAAGADAFVCKGDPPEYLLAALRSLAPPDELAGEGLPFAPNG